MLSTWNSLTATVISPILVLNTFPLAPATSPRSRTWNSSHCFSPMSFSLKYSWTFPSRSTRSAKPALPWILLAIILPATDTDFSLRS